MSSCLLCCRKINAIEHINCILLLMPDIVWKNPRIKSNNRNVNRVSPILVKFLQNCFARYWISLSDYEVVVCLCGRICRCCLLPSPDYKWWIVVHAHPFKAQSCSGNNNKTTTRKHLGGNEKCLSRRLRRYGTGNKKCFSPFKNRVFNLLYTGWRAFISKHHHQPSSQITYSRWVEKRY